MAELIRLRIAGNARGEATDVSVELVADTPCRIEIKTQARGDDQVGLNAPVRQDTHAVCQEGHHDRLTVVDVAHHTSDVPDRNVIRVGNDLYGHLGRSLSAL